MNIVSLLNVFAALLVVLGLAFIGALLFNRLKDRGALGGMLPMQTRNRLKLIESLAIDSKRHLVLVERDGTSSHLLLLGGDTETLLETNIEPVNLPIKEGRHAINSKI